MSCLRKVMTLAFLACAPAWAQSSSPPAQPTDPQAQLAQPPPPSSDSEKKTSPDQPPAPEPGDSTKLELIKSQKAAYPDEAREKQLQGQVMVKMLVSETGDVDSVEVLSGDPILAKAAVASAIKWKFKPFIKNGKPVQVFTKVPFDFAFSGNVSDPTQKPQRVRVSSGVSSGLQIHRVNPVYPMEARQARIQGTIILEAQISKEGKIVNLRLISGPPELAPAAMGAVQRWRYRPYLLQGVPVEVDTQIQVNFELRY
jgi:TonB family protein